MPNFQLLSCDVALAGDILNVVSRHAFIPVTYPEMLVLRYLHGENAITNIFDVGYVERDEDSEFKRLQETYGAVVKDKLFPGAGTRIPQGDNRYKPAIKGTRRNPAPVLPAAPVVPNVPDLPTQDATVSPATGAGTDGADLAPQNYTVQDRGVPSDYVPVAPADPAGEPDDVTGTGNVEAGEAVAPNSPPRARRPSPVAAPNS